MRRAHAIDENQPDIVSALRTVGCGVEPIAEVGRGVPDLLVWVPNHRSGRAQAVDRGITVLMEVKDGGKPPSARKLTEAQQRWIAHWPGKVWVVESIDDALAVVDEVGGGTALPHALVRVDPKADAPRAGVWRRALLTEAA